MAARTSLINFMSWVALPVLFLFSVVPCVASGSEALPETAAVGLDKIQHIVFIVKENRSFDNYFGTFPGANGATSGKISTGQVIPLGHAPDILPRDISHTYQSAVTAIHGRKMDRFDLIP